jgi:hypothetical protein
MSSSYRLRLSHGHKKAPKGAFEVTVSEQQAAVKLVAGAGFEPTTFGL